MASLKYSTNNTQMGEDAKKLLRYSQGVRIGDRIEISGQGGWDPNRSFADISIPEDLDEQIDQAFANVDLTLKAAGGKGWSQVYKVISLHVGLDGPDGPDSRATKAMVRNYEKWMPNHQPLWTQYGVAALGHPAMKIEIDVVAYVGE